MKLSLKLLLPEIGKPEMTCLKQRSEAMILNLVFLYADFYFFNTIKNWNVISCNSVSRLPPRSWYVANSIVAGFLFLKLIIN